MPHSAPAETLHDTLRLHGTQAVLALCVVVRAQFCREPCEKNNEYLYSKLYDNVLSAGDMLVYSGFVNFHEIFETLW